MYVSIAIKYPVPVNQSVGNCGKVARCIKCPIEGCECYYDSNITMEPVYNGHPWDLQKRLLYRGDLII